MGKVVCKSSHSGTVAPRMVQSMAQTKQNGTDGAALPVALGAAGARPSLARSGADAAFVSQLLAARDRLPPQRKRRLSSTEGAIGAYARGARMGERRMPMGYRKTVVV